MADEIWDLENLKRARGLGDWVFEQFRPHVRGRVAEIGAGIGTYSERIAATAGVDDLLLVEPEPACAGIRARLLPLTPLRDRASLAQRDAHLEECVYCRAFLVHVVRGPRM